MWHQDLKDLSWKDYKQMMDMMIVEETGKEHGSHTAFVNQFANWPGSDKSAKFSWPRSPPSDMPNIFLFSHVYLSEA